MKKKIILLMGLPSVGKTTYINNEIKEEYFLIREDDIMRKALQHHDIDFQNRFIFPNKNEKEGDVHSEWGKIINKDNELWYERILELQEDILERIEETKMLAGQQELPIVVDMTLLFKDRRNAVIESITNKNSDDLSIKDEYEVQVIEFYHKSATESALKVVDELGRLPEWGEDLKGLDIDLKKSLMYLLGMSSFRELYEEKEGYGRHAQDELWEYLIYRYQPIDEFYITKHKQIEIDDIIKLRFEKIVRNDSEIIGELYERVKRDDITNSQKERYNTMIELIEKIKRNK